VNTQDQNHKQLLEEIQQLQERIKILEKEKERRSSIFYPGLSVITNFEKNLIENEEKLKLAVEIANIGIWEWNLQTDIVSISEKLAEILSLEKGKKIQSIEWLNYIHPNDKAFCQKSITQAIEEKGDFAFEHRIVVENDVKWVVCKGKIITEKDNVPIKIMGNVIDITELKTNQKTIIQSQERLQKQNKALLELSSKNVFYSENIEHAFEEILNTAANILEVERIGLWFLKENNTSISHSFGVYNNKFSKEKIIIEKSSCPVYFKALTSQKIIATDDVFNDKNTLELKEYCKTHNIGSIMDIPININGNFFGIVCFEHTGKSRSWTFDEMNFGGTVVNMISLVIEINERKKVEQQIEISEKSYSDLFNHSEELFYIQDKEGRFVDVNLAVIQKYGYKKEEIINNTPEMLGAPGMNNFQQINQKLQLAWDGTSQKFDWWSRKKNGEIFPKEIIIRKGSFFGKEVLIGEGRDISERIENQKQLEQKEENYRLLFENNMAGVFRSTLDGKLLECNQANAEILGFKNPEEAKKYNTVEFYEIKDEREKYIKELIKKKRISNYLIKHRKATGQEGWSLSSVTLIEKPGKEPELLGTIIDITDLKNAEKTLYESEQRFRLLSEVAIEGIILSENGVIIDCNDRYYEMLEFSSKEELINKTLFDFVHPEDLHTVKNIIKVPRPSAHEVRLITKNNNIIWVESRGQNIPFNGRKVRVSVLYDITERKKIEDSLKERERSISTLMGNLPGMAYRCKNDDAFTMEFVSEKCILLTEYNQHQIVYGDVTFDELIHPNDISKVYQIIRSSINIQQNFGIEYRIITASGKIKWVWEQGTGIYNSKGECTHLEGFITDISERKEFENLIRQSRKNFKSLVENSPVGVLIIQDEKVIFSNPVAKSILKISNTFRIDKASVFDFILPEYHKIIREKFNELLSDKSLEFTEIKVVALDGSVLDVETNGTKIEFLGKPSIQVVFHDISFRKQLQKEQMRAEIAEETNKKLQLEIEERLKVEIKLRDNQKFTKSIIDSSLDMICAIDEKGRIIEFNEAAQNTFGYSFEEAICLTAQDLYADKLEYVRVGSIINKKGKFSGEIVNKRKDGKLFTIYLSAAQLLDEKGENIGSMGVSRDITEVKKQEKIKELQFSISRVLNEAPSFSEAVPGILSSFIDELDFTYGEVWLANPQSKSLTFFAHQILPSQKSRLSKEFLKISKQIDQKDSDTLPYRVFSKGKPLWIEDISKHQHIIRKPEATSSGFISCFGFPIKSGKNTIGVVNFFSTKFTSEDKEMISLFNVCGAQIGQFYIRKKAEEELRESEEKFKAIYDVAAVGIARVGLNGSFIQVNKKLCQILGYTEQEIYKLKFKEITHPDDVEKSLLYLEKLLAKEITSFASEKKYFHKNGSVVYINLTVSVVNDKNGDPDYFVSVFEDITDRKKSEEHIFKQAAKLNSIIESSSHQIWTMNSNMELTSFNKNYFKVIKAFYGVDAEIGANLREGSKKFLDKSTFEVIDKFYQDAFKGLPQHFEFPFKHKNGKEIWLETFLNPIKLERGKIEEIACIAQDITEKKYAEVQIKNSLKEKEVLLKEVHHRVKNNLQVITSILNLQSSNIKDKRILDFLTESQNRIKSMAFIHESLYQTKDFSRINFAEYLQNLSKNLVHSYNLSNKYIGLKLNIEELYLNLDLAIPCGLIINELVSNSLKYAFPKGSKGHVGIKLKKTGNKISLSVKDTGKGFPKNLDFKNTESLGLQLVTTLTDQIQGEISMKSSPLKGTEFLIKFKTN
jgi:PAS domain S-box-containing protein